VLWDCGAEAGGEERHSEANNGLASGNLRRRETRRQNKGRDCSIFCLMYLCSASHVESAIVERGEKASMDKSRDQDRGKGAMEQDQRNQGGNTSMQGQLGHRDEDAELKNADADLSG